ncbi:MAG: hypothetical protein K9G12_06215 [Candidatus Nanopelagicales bacterium]|nr:hypothetical protein [Candidatus Nanopelagicales bacterium]MCF8539858.1 hypothetical protein [Candidatus Nanopelagicales bacterium]
MSGNLRGLRFSNAVMGIYALASFVGALIAFASSNAGIALAVGTAGLVTVTAVAILLLLRLVVSGTRDVHAGVFVLLSLGVGVLRGVVMTSVAIPWGLMPQSNGPTQIINSGVSAVVWLFLAGLLLAGRERYRQKYRSLLVQGAASVESESLLSADWDNNPSIVAMRVNIAEHVGDPNVELTPESLMQTSEAIRTEIEQNLRPLSHRLWFGSFDEYPHVRLSRLVRDSVTYFRVPVWPISVAWLIGGLVGGPMLFGVARGILATVISTVVLVVLLVIFRRMAATRPSVVTGTVFVVLSGTLPLIAADLLLRAANFESDFNLSSGLVVFLPLALITMLLMALSISLAHSDRDAVLRVAQRFAVDCASGFANSLEASTYLHNTLQSELTGVALQLRRAAESEDAELSRVAMERAREIVNRSVTEDYAQHRIDPIQHAQRVAAAWKGICAVDIQFGPGVDGDIRALAATQAVEELITNAVRHAGATDIAFTLDRVDAGVQISGRVNRLWTETAHVGLGSRWFATLSPQGVQTEQVRGWTHVRLVIE